MTEILIKLYKEGKLNTGRLGFIARVMKLAHDEVRKANSKLDSFDDPATKLNFEQGRNRNNNDD